MKLRYLIILIPIYLTATTFLQASDTLYDSRFKNWKDKANKGDAFSQYSLGNAYLRGNEVNIDVNKALHWFKEAAKNGHAKSEYKLGYIYYSGKGVKRDNKIAIEWFTKAAEHNYSPAQFYLGKMYAAGQGTEQDTDTALKWLNAALKNDYTPAKREIARIEKSKSNESPVKTAKVKRPVKKKVFKTKVIKKSGKQSFDVAALLAEGRWMLENKPSEILPSNLNECNADENSINCKTDELSKSTADADISYKRESTMSKLTSNGRFLVTTKENTLFVLPTDPDNPDVDPESIPATGWALPQRLICKFKTKHKITCSTDDYQKITFKRDF